MYTMHKSNSKYNSFRMYNIIFNIGTRLKRTGRNRHDRFVIINIYIYNIHV